MKEELRHQRRNSKSRTLVLAGLALVLVATVAGGIWFRYHLDEILEADFARAERLQGAGAYAEAARIFELIHRRHSHFRRAAEALYQVGEIRHLYLQDYPQALLAYLLVEKDFPESPLASQAMRQVADLYKNQLRDYAQAIVVYQKLLDREQDGRGDAIQYQVADCYFRLNNFEQARIEFESLLKNYPASDLSAEAQYRVAVSTALEGDGKRALAAFERVEKDWPDSPYAIEARLGRAGVLEEREDLAGASRVLEALRGVYPNAEVLEKRMIWVKDRIRKKQQGK